MYTQDDREELRRRLLDHARRDTRISGAAVTGSGSAGNLDAWSDIDLAFGVRDASSLGAVLDDFTTLMRRDEQAVDTVDVVREPWVYRVFLLPNTLQVDLAFAPATHFGARAPTFRLVFGEATEPGHVPPPDARELVGYAWLYALHVRSAIARRKLWQADYMLSAMRDQVIALACVRLGLPAREARGADQLPPEVTRPLEATLVGVLRGGDFTRAFTGTANALVDEVRYVDERLAERLRPVLDAMRLSLPAGEPPLRSTTVLVSRTRAR